MRTLYAFFAIDCDKLTPPMTIASVRREAVHCETVESRAYDGFDDIDRAFGREVTGQRYGTFSRDEARVLARELSSATDDILSKMNERPLVAEFYWAMRLAAELAAERGLCMSVRYTNDPEEEQVAALAEAALIRAEDAEVAAVAREEIAPYLSQARALVAALEERHLVVLSRRVRREELAQQFAEILVDSSGAVEPADAAEWFVDHAGVDDVFASDADFRALLAEVASSDDHQQGGG